MNKSDIEQKTLELREKLGMFKIYHEKILRDRLEENGYFLFYYPFGKSNFSGASYAEKGTRVIIVNSSYTLGRQNFTLAHELGHVELHKNFNTIDLDGEDKAKEKEADFFAACFLMPKYDVLSSQPETTKDPFDLMKLSQKFHVSYEVAYIRACNVFGNRFIPDWLKKIKVTEVAKTFEMDLSLYEPTEEKYMSERLYVEKTVDAYKKHKISMGKFLSLAKDIGLDGYEILDKIRDEKNVRG